jgi:O-antigen/teichoic acid export membrane protein
MSLIPRQANPPLDAICDEVDVAAALVAHDTTEVRPLAPVAAHEIEDRCRRRWWHLGPYIDRVRSDSLLRNSLFIMANTAVTSVLGYAFWLMAAHMYSVPIVGLAVAITAAVSTAVTVAYVGVGGTLIQSLPRQSTDTGWSRTFWAGMATVVFFAMVICGVALMVLPSFSPHMMALRSVDYAAVFAVGALAVAAGLTLDQTYIAERRARDMFARNSAAGVVKLIMLVLLGLAAGSGAMRLLGAWVGASVVGVGLGAALLIRQGRVARPPALSVLVRTALGFRSRVTGYQLAGLGPGLMPYLLALIVTERLSTADNAYYFTTWTMSGVILIVAPAVSMSLFAEGVHRPDEIGALARSAFRIIGSILVPGLVAMFIVGGTLLGTFGPAYADHAGGLLRIFVLSSVPGALNSVYGGILQAQGRLTAVASMSVGVHFGTLIISWFLLPVIGISAVGWALLAMQLCGSVYVVLDWRRHMSPKRPRSGRHPEEVPSEAGS